MGISKEYSIDLLRLISSMLCIDRVDRPTASQIKNRLLDLIGRYLDSDPHECRKCNKLFATKRALQQRLRDSGHSQNASPGHILGRSGTPIHQMDVAIRQEPALELVKAFRDNGLVLFDHVQGSTSPLFQANDGKIASNTYDSVFGKRPDHTPCAVCIRRFGTKKSFFQHLHCGHHWRGRRYV